MTDHNTIAGALEIQRSQTSRVVVGEEITTADGELIGLFLTEPVAAGLEALETARRIHAQGGVVYLQHPFDSRRNSIRAAALEAIADHIDIVEVFNARSSTEANARAKDLQETLGVPAGAGSDAHRASEIGRVYVEMEPFSGPEDFLLRLRGSRVVTGHARWWMWMRARLPSAARR